MPRLHFSVIVFLGVLSVVFASSKYGMPSVFLSNWKDMMMTYSTNRNYNTQSPIRPNGMTGLRISADWSQSAISSDTFAVRWNGRLYGANSSLWDGVSLLDAHTGEWTTTFSSSAETTALPFAVKRSYFMPPGEPFVLVRYTLTAPTTATGPTTVSLADFVTSDHPASSALLFGWRCTPSQYAAAAANDAPREGNAAELYMVDARKTGGFYLSMGAFQQVSTHQVGSLYGAQCPQLQYNGGGMAGQDAYEGPQVQIGLEATVSLAPGASASVYFFRTVQTDWDPAVKASLRALSKSPEEWIAQTGQAYEAFLAKGKRPVGLTADQLQMYDASVMLMKNAQNPTLGTIVASFHPAYGFKVWARDGLFAALIMSECGYDAEANAYIKWMAQAELRAQTGEGFHTCYDFWTGKPVGFVEPQYDSAGAFLLGAYHMHVAGFALDDFVLSRVHDLETFFLNKRGLDNLAPPDYSIWEESSDPHTGKGLALSHFAFSQAMAYGGLVAASRLENALGDTSRCTQDNQRATEIRAAVRKHLWMVDQTMNVGYFARGLWSDTGALDTRADSSSLALIYLGLVEPTEAMAKNHLSFITTNLSQNGGAALSRYYEDPFFYDSIYNPGGREVGAPGAPWGVVTMFGVWAELTMGRAAADVMPRIQWMVAHSAAGNLPVGEAVDGVSGEFVWSSCPDLYESGGVYMWSVLMAQGKARLPNPTTWGN